jgi:hypothetical protein
VALLDDFKARFPAFDTATADAYVPIVELVWPSYYNFAYDETTKEAILNLVAHLILDETSSGDAGLKSQTSKSVGSVSVSYAAASHSGGARFDFFNTTKFGRRFYQLTQRNAGGVAV